MTVRPRGRTAWSAGSRPAGEGHHVGRGESVSCCDRYVSLWSVDGSRVAPCDGRAAPARRRGRRRGGTSAKWPPRPGSSPAGVEGLAVQPLGDPTTTLHAVERARRHLAGDGEGSSVEAWSARPSRQLLANCSTRCRWRRCTEASSVAALSMVTTTILTLTWGDRRGHGGILVAVARRRCVTPGGFLEPTVGGAQPGMGIGSRTVRSAKAPEASLGTPTRREASDQPRLDEGAGPTASAGTGRGTSARGSTA